MTQFPKENDAVMGGDIPPFAAVLGGLEGVKRDLKANLHPTQQIEALQKATRYGGAGLDLIIAALENESKEVSHAAYILLGNRTEPKIKQALKKLTIWGFLEFLDYQEIGEGTQAVISPDLKYIVGASGYSDGTIRVWELETKELQHIFIGHPNGICSIVITPDSKYMVSVGGECIIKIWDIETGKLQKTLSGGDSFVHSVAVSPNGKYIVSSNDYLEDSTIEVWELKTGTLLYTLTVSSGWIGCLAISPDGQYIVSGISIDIDTSINVWDLETGELLHNLSVYLNPFSCVAISPDGKYIISCSDALRVWDLETAELLRSLRNLEDSFNSIDISSDGKHIVTAMGYTIKIFDFETLKEEWELFGYEKVYSVAISLDNNYIVSGGDTVKLWRI